MCKSVESGVLPWQREFAHTIVKGTELSVIDAEHRQTVWDGMTTEDQIAELSRWAGYTLTADELVEMVVESHGLECGGPIFALRSLSEVLTRQGYGGVYLHPDVLTTD